MKRIVIDARELRTSTGRYVERLLAYLQEVDTDLSHRYIVLLKPKDMDGWTPKSKRFTKVACRYKEFTFGEQLGFAWQLYKLKADLVHFTIVQQPILYQRKVVTTMQDLTTLRFVNPSKNPVVFKLKQWVYKWVNIIAARKSKTIITPTEFVKDDVAKFTHTNSRKITVTLEAGNTIEATAEPVEALEGKQFIMYTGRPTPHKNLEGLIAAFALMKETRPELHLVLVGKTDKNYKRHAARVEKEAIPGVHFTDFIPDGQLKWLYEHCAAYVFPSFSEGFGLPPLEAMSCGAPVVASNASCIPEVLGEAARYFDPYSTHDMVRAICDVLDKPALRQKLIADGKKQVGKYSWKRMAEQTLAVYNQVLGN